MVNAPQYPRLPGGSGPGDRGLPGAEPILETQLDRTHLEALVSAEAAGYAAPGELELLQADPAAWADALHRLILETEEALAAAGRITGDERQQVLDDLGGERSRLQKSLRRLTGVNGSGPDRGDDDDDDDDVDEPGVLALQASWDAGDVVVWAAARSVPAAGADEVHRLVAEAGGATVEWSLHRGVPLPTGEKAAAVTAPVSGALGWLVGVGAGQLGSDAAPSAHWLGDVAVWATELVALGRMAPTLTRADKTSAPGRHGTGRFAVRWAPAVVDAARLRELASRMPGAVAALTPAPSSPEKLCRAVLAAAVDAICRAGAGRLVTAATAAVARTRSDMAETVLARLDGAPFTANARPAGEMADELKRWASPVLSAGTVGLTVRLDAPEKDGGWLLSVEVSGVERHLLPVEEALAAPNRAKAQEVNTQLRRLERLLPPLLRPTRTRGRVVLGADEAWDLMTRTGAALVAAGFDVRVPAASRRRTGPRLHLQADAFTKESKVGAQQLSKVRWSVLFGDAELDGAEIARLAAQARPLVRVKGRWVELERADLDAAARALAEAVGTTELSGAAILRHAVGLEGTALGGSVVVDGGGWAVDIVKGATETPPQPLPAPDGFVGDLRSYQAEARGWLRFLDGAGLGGCLAMDMGLGKTPTVLAHVLETRADGPVLVVAPPAVLGNWAAEAARFTPELRVRVHHGTDRATAAELAAEVAGADVVLTTYATAVRDVEALAGVEWHRVVVDEAQTIKNPASETAKQLRRVPARNRLALTGTPIENGLGDLWAILDFTNPGLVGPRSVFVEQLSKAETGSRPGEAALRALNGLLVFRRSKSEPEIAAELPDKIDELDHCGMTPEQIGLYQAVLDRLVPAGADVPAGEDPTARKGQVLAAITALKQICDHPAAYLHDDRATLEGRSGKLTRLNELLEAIFAAGERVLIFTHFASWGERLAGYLTDRHGLPVACYHGGLTRPVRDRLVDTFQNGTGPGALVLSIKAGGSGLNLTAASHVVLYDRWWNPAVEDQARDRAWRIGQKNAVVSHRLVCPGTVDERVEEVVAGKRRIADLALPASSSLGDLGADQLRAALGLRPDEVIAESAERTGLGEEETAA